MEEQKVKFMWNAAQVLVCNSYATTILKSHYLNRCKEYAQHHVKVPNKLFGPEAMCEKCCTPWHENQNSSKILAAKFTHKQVARILSRHSKKNRALPPDMSLAKYIADNLKNKMVRKCHICKHTTVVKLDKPKPVKEVTPIESTKEIVALSSKKKKRKHDKFAGLSESAVISATPTNSKTKTASRNIKRNTAEIENNGTTCIGQNYSEKVQQKNLTTPKKSKASTKEALSLSSIEIHTSHKKVACAQLNKSLSHSVINKQKGNVNVNNKKHRNKKAVVLSKVNKNDNRQKQAHKINLLAKMLKDGNNFNSANSKLQSLFR